MQAPVQLPKAFSVRDENEFLPIQHLLARLNPQLRVRRIATGVHVDGGTTVFWGVVYREGQTLTKGCVESALREAGFDFGHNVLIQASDFWTAHPRVCA
jgi:hypothetical protein